MDELILGLALTFSRQPFVAEARLRSQASPRGIYGGKNDTGTSFLRVLRCCRMSVISSSVTDGIVS
jgi:hypothetical protein